MNRCTAAALTSAGTPALEGEEQVLKLQSNVDLYDGDEKSDRKGGIAAVTTHRLIWCSGDRRSGIQWTLAMVEGITTTSGGFFSSPKITVNFRSTPIAPPPLPGVELPTPKPYAPPHHIKLSFKSGGRDDFEEPLSRALRKRSWVVESPPSKRPKATGFTTRQAGIGGIMKSQHTRIKADAALASAAFSSLKDLVENAKPIVALAERYARSVQGSSGSTAAAGAGGQTAGEQAEFGNLLRDIGITSPVTKAAAGDLFDEELARQLAEFLHPRLARAGGLLTLTDAYCMYNRARGTDLVSPEDVVGACALFEKLHLGMHVRTFESGVKVVELASHSGDAIAAKLQELLEGREFINAVELSAAWKVPLPIAQRHLEEAERRTVVCRDDTMRGLRFYPNMFMVAT